MDSNDAENSLQCTAKQHQSDAYNFVQGLCHITKKTLNHVQATN